MKIIDIFEELGVRRVINAAGTYTVWGGSRMSEQTLSDMSEIAGSFVSIKDLQSKVHKKLAQITNNEGAYICNGAAAGVYLAVAAAISTKLQKPFFYLTQEEIAKCEVIVFKPHRNPYDYVLKQLGVKVVEIGYANNILPSINDDISYAINENTVALYYLVSGWAATGALSIEKVYSVTKLHSIPIIVDAAAQLPPVENFWKFGEQGAECTIFSGGKDIKGPQSSGLIVGKLKFLEEIAEVGFPNYGIGRMIKVGREEIVGLYSAVKQFIETDHIKRAEDCEQQIIWLRQTLENDGIYTVERSYPNEAGQPIPRAFVALQCEEDCSDKLINFLLEGEPCIYATNENRKGVYINPMTLTKDEIGIIARRLLEFENQYLNQ